MAGDFEGKLDGRAADAEDPGILLLSNGGKYEGSVIRLGIYHSNVETPTDDRAKAVEDLNEGSGADLNQNSAYADTVVDILMVNSPRTPLSDPGASRRQRHRTISPLAPAFPATVRLPLVCFR